MSHSHFYAKPSNSEYNEIRRSTDVPAIKSEPRTPEALSKSFVGLDMRDHNAYCCHGHVEEDATERHVDTSTQLSRALSRQRQLLLQFNPIRVLKRH